MELTYTTEQIQELINLINSLPIDFKIEGNFITAQKLNQIFSVLNIPFQERERKQKDLEKEEIVKNINKELSKEK